MRKHTFCLNQTPPNGENSFSTFLLSVQNLIRDDLNGPALSGLVHYLGNQSSQVCLTH